jgi:hypothetical protein
VSASDQSRRGAGFWPKRVGLATLMLLVGINIWTGGPLFAIWVGSRVQASSGLSMGSVVLVIAIMATVSFLLVTVLSRLGQAYDTLTGREPEPRQRAPWLRSMRDEPDKREAHASQLSAFEKTLVLSVVLAVLAAEVWFFFFAGSSLPRGT